MAEQKTKPTDESVERYLNQIEDEGRRKDCYEILEMMEGVTGESARMWGSSMIGFGSYHYRYASGHEGDAPLAGFAPRKRNITLYLCPGMDRFEEELQQLGKHKAGKGCLYINKLTDVDKDVLRDLVTKSKDWLEEQYGSTSA